jgi:hypothetical protein
MSVTRENRKIRDYLRKRLIRLAGDTGGDVFERPGSGGKIVSTYRWRNEHGEKSFRISWHNSISDRHFPKKIRGDIRRNLLFVSDLFIEDSSKQSELSDFGLKFFRDTNNTLPADDVVEWKQPSLVAKLRDLAVKLVGQPSWHYADIIDEIDDEKYPSDPLGLADMVSFGSQYFGGIKVASDDIYNFGTNVVFLFHEMDTIAMTHANRSLWGWSERHLFWCYRRNPKFFSSKGIAP